MGRLFLSGDKGFSRIRGRQRTGFGMKRIAIAAVTVIAILAILLAAVPFVISGDFLKDRIARQIAVWTGRPVTITGDPNLALYPSLAITVDGLTIGNPEGMGDDAFVAADGLRATMQILPLLYGQTVFDEVELIAPRLRLVVDKDGRTNWGMAESRIAKQAMRAAEAAAAPTPAEGVLPAAIAIPTDVRIGHLRITNGTILYDDLRTERREEFSAVSLDATWPSAAAAGRGSGSLQWRGETVAFNGSVTDPLKLIAGGTSDVRFAVASTPLRLSFSGQASGGGVLLEGHANTTTPSLRRTIGWLGTPLGTGPILGAASIDGAVKIAARAVAFDRAAIELDGNVAVGDIAATFAGPRPVVTASISAEKLDLSAYLEAARADLVAAGSWLIAPTQLDFADALDATFNISAGQVLIGATRIDQVAAVATTHDGILDVRVEEAQLHGGTLTAAIDARMIDDDLVANANAAIAGVPAGVALTDAFGITALDGTATANIAIGSRGKSWGAFVRAIGGTAKVALTDGTLAGFDILEVAAVMADPLADPIAPEDKETAFQRLAATLAISEGDLTTEDLRMEGRGYSVTVAGKGSVLNGLVSAKARVITGTTVVPLTITGRWRLPSVVRDTAPDASDDVLLRPTLQPTGG